MADLPPPTPPTQDTHHTHTPSQNPQPSQPRLTPKHLLTIQALVVLAVATLAAYDLTIADSEVPLPVYLGLLGLAGGPSLIKDPRR